MICVNTIAINQIALNTMLAKAASILMPQKQDTKATLLWDNNQRVLTDNKKPITL